MGQPQLITQGLLAADMTSGEARECVQAIKDHMQDARSKLLELYTREGWRALGYGSWQACVVTEFEQSKSYLLRQLQAAQIEQALELPMGNLPERQLRPLSSLERIQQRDAWQRAIETAPNGKVTAAHVEQVVEAIREHERAGDLRPLTAATVIEHIRRQPESIKELAGVAGVNRMAVHHSSATPEWYTPKNIIDVVLAFFDEIDLDPCSNSRDEPNVPARQVFTEADDGLTQDWWGRVYMNPPYGDAIGAWVDKLCAAYDAGQIEAAIALVPGRLDTAWFDRLTAYALCFVRGRLRFVGAENSAPFPSVLVYLGDEVERFRETVRPLGKVFVQVGVKPGDRQLVEDGNVWEAA